MTEEQYLAVVRRRIRNARLAMNLRQEDVAEQLGISLRSYQRYEGETAGRGFNPYALTLRRIARALGQDAGQLMREPDPVELSDLASPLRRAIGKYG